MSIRMTVLNVVLDKIVRPHLARSPGPEAAHAEFERVAARVFKAPPFTSRLERQAGDVRLHWIRSGAVKPGKVILYFHGGAYFAGSGKSHSAMLARVSRLSGYEVCAPDYRLLQDGPFPAAVDDALQVWQHLLALGYRPEDIIISGDSAGGGLAFALLALVLARGERPAALFALSPWTDLTLSSESMSGPDAHDVVLPLDRVREAAKRYLDGHDPSDPRASPLFADFTNPPPVMIQVGSDEALYDDSTRIEAVLRQAGGEVLLQSWDKAPHVWQIFDGYLPEARAALIQVADFVQASFAQAKR